MKITKAKAVKVGSHVKPIHFRLRKEPELIVGKDYYISFGMNKAIPCTLINIIDTGGGIPKQVQIGIKDNSPLGYGDINLVYADEIGLTPEEAVVNTQTS